MQENSTLAAPSDVVVIGGGPAGSTLAALVREQGLRVVLLEKDRHPRFHIGESLLPLNLPLLARLGVLEQVAAIGVVKYGAEFASAGRAPQRIYFADAIDRSHPYAFQVRRAEFDQILLANSAARGVEVHEGITVNRVEFRPGHTSRVHSSDEHGRARIWETRFVVDASGRDTLLARQFRIKHKDPRHQSAAIFGHFNAVERRTGRDAGNIGVYWFEHGWCWLIPLQDGSTSVGAVCWPEYLKTRRGSPEEFFQQTIALCPPVQARMRQAELLGPVRVTGNYSYRAERMYGDGYLIIGDAFAFIDPVFSTGVHLAMQSAALGAEAVTVHLRDPVAAKALFANNEKRIRRALRTVAWFIYRFTSPAMQRLFMAPRNYGRMQEAITSMLAGDVFGKTPLALPLLLFKTFYRLALAGEFAANWTAYRHRRHNRTLHLADGAPPPDRC